MKKLLFFLLVGLLMSSAAAAQCVGEGWVLVFQDEFDQPDGTAPDSAKWQACPRRNATWNRQIANSDSTVFVRDGALVCRALRNGDLKADSVPMLTGAIESRDLFAFTYGRVDVRLKTNLLAGNFPAAWMKPQPPCAPWPDSGEIDIFESIDSDPRAYHTVHTHWTRRLGRRHEPQSSFNEPVSVDSFHVYSIEWDSVSISWFVDGDWKGTYPKSSDETALSRGQWPFDAPFYIVLNQSVGDGSWAAPFNPDFIYETCFDYVRVYQRKRPPRAQ